MSDAHPNGSAPARDRASVPEGLVAAVVNLVGTGPVMLGAYTIAELTAVDAIVDFLSARPSDDVLAEAVRSLAARQLLVAGPPGEQVQVRGDLGIAVTFEQRARMVLDARSTGTGQGEPWRMLLLPQPEEIALVFSIDALGVHQIGLYTSDDALRMLADWLPSGSRADAGENSDADSVLASSERTALVTATEYTTRESAEIAGASTDLVLARHSERLHVFGRDAEDGVSLVPSPRPGDDVQEMLIDLLEEHSATASR